MTSGGGTPDHVASMIRFHSRCRPARRAHVCLAILPLSFVLVGCMPGQPFVRDDGAGSIPEETVTAQREPVLLPAIRNRFSSPIPSATLPASGAGPAKIPSGPWSGTSPPRRRHLVKLSPSLRSDETPAAPPDTVKISPAPWPPESPATHSDTWARIRGGLSTPYRAHPRVVREIGWYRKHQKYLHRTVQRARPYLAYIVRQVERRGMPIEIALLPIVESGFQPFAESPAGASGLWQFIPSTGKVYGLKQDWWYDGRRDIVASTRAALDYLSKLSHDFEGDWPLALAAYNWGEGNIRRAVARNRARGKPVDIWSLRLPGETRVYLSRLLAIAAIVADPDRYDIALAAIPDRVPFQQVDLHGQIDLRAAADLAGITLDELHMLNPGFRRWTTGPDGPHRLQLPRHATQRFRARLAGTSTGRQPVDWARYEIVRGDTLGAIASRYRTSVAALKKFNRLSSDRIQAGRHLMVPVSTRTIDGPRLAVHRRSTRFSQLDPSAPPVPAMPAARRSAAFAAPPGDVHVVVHGDTLFNIARRHGTTVRRLAELNRIGADAVLQLGQRVRVTPGASSETPAPGDRGRIRYQVKQGDSLWGISRQFGVSVADLREWNRLSKGKPLMPGRELDVHVKRPPAI